MNYEDSHPSDQQLLLAVEGELSRHDEKMIRAHLAACWKCRARRNALENAITDFVRVYQTEFDERLPPAAGPRALLNAQLAQLSSQKPARHLRWFPISRTSAMATAICAVVIVGILLTPLRVTSPTSSRAQETVIAIPDPRLTPGVTLLVNRPVVCAQPDVNNKAVPATVQKQVFEEYGIRGADPRAYEVDYLITPALGGADDIHNLWPHSYSATVWNASVKDALEDRLREMVCDGGLDLTAAQQAIATNWIAAYKKYFHTDRPLVERWK